jgi:hypothetical protein
MKFRVIQETVTEELVEVEAEDESEAINLVTQGLGTLVDQTLTWPTIIDVQELDNE